MNLDEDQIIDAWTAWSHSVSSPKSINHMTGCEHTSKPVSRTQCTRLKNGAIISKNILFLK